jgi:asparagine synthase (glutamine-hydrolysing)
MPSDRRLAVAGKSAQHAFAEGCEIALIGKAYWRASAGSEQPAASPQSIAAEFHRQGEAVLQLLHGHFSLAIVDSAHRRGLLAVDRMGVGTIAYAELAGGELVFGSHAATVARHPSVDRELDPQAIFNYLFFHVVPAPRTIFRRVRKLDPGECLVWQGGERRVRPYWQMHYADAVADRDALLDEFRQTLRTVVGRAADEPRVGAFLSGGTDSSTVTGVLSELRGGSVPAYSIGFDAAGFDEIGYARLAARRFGVDHRVYYVTPEDVAAATPLLAAGFDEPFGNASVLPAYCCARRAHEDGVDTLLAGDGGDELFGGNARYAKQKVFQAYWFLPDALRRGFLEPLLAGDGAPSRFRPLAKAQSYVRQARVPLPDRLESYNFLVRTPVAEVLDAEFLRSIDSAEPFALMRECYERTASRAEVDRMMHLDLKITLADSDLRKVVGACARAGVDVRFPLLDDQMVEFSGRVPPGDKVRGLKLRYLFKEALRDFLPAEILAKEKHGFGLPFGVWLQNDARLREQALGALESFRGRGILRRDFIDETMARHAATHASYFGVMVWVIQALEFWLQSHGQGRGQQDQVKLGGAR